MAWDSRVLMLAQLIIDVRREAAGLWRFGTTTTGMVEACGISVVRSVDGRKPWMAACDPVGCECPISCPMKGSGAVGWGDSPYQAIMNCIDSVTTTEKNDGPKG